MVYEGLIMVISAGIMAAGALASGALGVAGNAASTKKQYEYQRRLQAQAAQLNYNYNRQWAQNSPTFTREGLEAGGYNPMLAVQNGTSNATSWTSPGQSQSVNYGDSIQAGFSNVLDFQKLRNETAQSQAVAQNLNADTAGKLETNKYIPDRQKAEISNLNAQTSHFNAMIDNMKARIQLDRELGYAGFSNAKDVAHIQSNAIKYGADVSANSTPFKYASTKIDKYGRKYLPQFWL